MTIRLNLLYDRPLKILMTDWMKIQALAYATRMPQIKLASWFADGGPRMLQIILVVQLRAVPPGKQGLLTKMQVYASLLFYPYKR